MAQDKKAYHLTGSPKIKNGNTTYTFHSQQIRFGPFQSGVDNTPLGTFKITKKQGKNRIGADPEFPDLSLRDAAAVREFDQQAKDAPA